jgi:formylglycine-generating enzyme required for sulfatase activity
MNFVGTGYLRSRKALVLVGAVLATVMALAPSALAAKPAVLTFTVAKIGAPENAPVGIVPFTDALYKTCAEAPPPKGSRAPACMEVGGVDYRYGIGQLEVTVPQYVAFLNTADPAGTNKRKLWSTAESGTAWPRFGQINFSAKAKPGRHYTVAAPEWADKPYGFANFLRSARFANSLYNGKVLAKKESSSGAFKYTTYRVRLSPQTETGMYDMRNPKTTRKAKVGFVIPSQNEWIKAAYYEPNGGGTYSYWKYPTNPGEVGKGMSDGPVQATLDPTTGDVTNAASQPLSIFHMTGTEPPTAAPYWCPSAFSSEICKTVNPYGIEPQAYEKAFAGSLGTVGQALTLSPWGTLDQGGNVVEWTDTITPPPFGVKGARVWRRLHGGIANAPVYQLWISAVGLQPQDNAFFTATYPWLGIRIGVVGNLKPGKQG